MFSLFRKKKVSFAGETAATILYPKWKDDTLPQYTNRSECLCYSGQEKSSQISHWAPNLSESDDAGRRSTLNASREQKIT